MRLLSQFSFALAAMLVGFPSLAAQPSDSPALADRSKYLAEIVKVCRTDWPKNRAVSIVCHGHSVPAGYFRTPEVRTFDAYPHLLHAGLAERFPHAVINVIVTAIGGENSVSGALRFDAEVLAHRPDLIAIDYALNDRRVGLERSRTVWAAMIAKAQAKGIKVILLTLNPDQSAKLDDPNNPLKQHAEQVRALPREYHTGLVDSLAAFKEAIEQGAALPDLMSQVNHPNRRGHELVAMDLLAWFD